MTRSLPIRWQLTLWYGGALAVVLAIFGTTTFLVMRHQLLVRTDDGLREELSEVVGEVQRARDRQGMLAWLDRRFARHEGIDFQITTQAGERVFANLRLADRRLPVPDLEPGTESPNYHTFSLPGAGRYRAVARGAKGPDGPLVIQVSRSLAEYDHELAELLAALLIAGPAALVLTIGGGYFLARRALSPVDRMTIAASKIDARQFDRRLEVVNGRDELGRLAQTLNHMLDRLERSFNEMRRFTADASHELRTPITVIRTEAEVALAKPLSEPEKQDLLGNILEECQQLTWITDQLLTLCREDAGISEISRESVDLAQLVGGVTETMRPLADAKSQRLTAAVNGSALVYGDPVRLRHVIYNLLDNAIKYTPTHGWVDVSVATLDHQVRLIVEDSGIGIPPEHLPHVFERFYRVDRARTRAEGGAGLGLSIVQSIVSAHEGTIELASRASQGTKCTVTFPLTTEDGAAPVRRQEPEPTMMGTKPRLFAIGIPMAIGFWTAAWAFEPPPPAKTEASANVSSTADEKTVRQLEKRLDRAVVQGDVATFNELLADDFTHTSQNGRFRTRPEWMKGRIQGKTNYVSFDVENLNIRMYGETAVVTGMSKPSWREQDGSLATGRFRFLRVWTKRDGPWQVAAFQSTRISDEKE